jgi:hypothetical protein
MSIQSQFNVWSRVGRVNNRTNEGGADMQWWRTRKQQQYLKWCKEKEMVPEESYAYVRSSTV